MNAPASPHEELVGFGFRWYVRDGDPTAHFARPSSDATVCGHVLTRRERRLVARDPEVHLCGRCRELAGIHEPNPRSSPPLDLPPRIDSVRGE